ncbi:hypothetical protein FM076_02425 [Streptomyces albus subsp. chlorinus]|uniref:DUF6271 family protein n=1 Tax=Streptomyces albus TaxID=1888 RepID=UPI0015710848|nr:DUF6271 family protein [Streptomyces albus]NSC20125.1 hypothetical protein [Streptomyces albus subsp. chlorinus]
MRRICLTLPTNRPCAHTITAVGEEAAHAVEHFDAEVHLLVLDSCAPAVRAEHAGAVRRLPASSRLTVHHLDEARQRDFLQRVVERAGSTKPELLLDLLLPDGLSYGACTDRAFLAAAALGCESVHRRDSDSRYQTVEGRPVFPVHHELRSLGKRAADAAAGVSETALAAQYAQRPVAMVGSSFVGELSVDIGEIRAADPEIYRQVVGLWAPAHWPAERKRGLAEESFRGAGTRPFERDHSVLTLVDPMRVDMCNISFHGVQERVPLPPARDTIGSDYFLLHLVREARLPGVLHNRNVVNYYTAERRTDAGFLAYQLRFAKFLLSMLHFHSVYAGMREAGDTLLDELGQVRAPAVAALARESARLDQRENVERLDVLGSAYRRLGGRYAVFADRLDARRERLLAEARGDIEDFALLTEAWGGLVAAAADTPLDPYGRPGTVGR